MDKDQARFILSNYRPGIDAADAKDLAAALALAADNRELGEWLAEQRAMDDAFTRALGDIELPDKLREDIIGCLMGDRRDYPQADTKQDAAMIGALAAVKVPAGLRENILAAMDLSAAGRIANEPTPSAAALPTPAPAKVVPIWKKLSMPLTAAAGIALALVITRPNSNNQFATNDLVPIEAVPVSFIQTFNAPDFDLEVKQERPDQLVEALKSRALPCPCCLPPGLEGVKTIGCRELNINGKLGSVICFAQNDVGVAHLVIFRREDVDGSCSNDLSKPCYIDKGEWSVARWQNDENVFFLIGHTQVAELEKLF